jgi:hypothetical protein
MALSSPLPGPFNILLYLICCGTAVLAQNESEQLPTFGDTVQVLGAVSSPSPITFDDIIDRLRWKERTKTSKTA